MEKQREAIEKERRITNIEKIKKELQEREQLLTFFDKREEIELQIEKIKKKERKEYMRIRMMPKGMKKLKALVATETYIPPDIKK